MEVKTTLKPGAKGTLSLVKKYGKKLISVRYRYDRAKGRRYKTVELIEEEHPWDPVLNYKPDKKVAIRINYSEQALREKVKAHGGYWDSKRKTWCFNYWHVLQLKLEDRVLDN